LKNWVLGGVDGRDVGRLCIGDAPAEAAICPKLPSIFWPMASASVQLHCSGGGE